MDSLGAPLRMVESPVSSHCSMQQVEGAVEGEGRIYNGEHDTLRVSGTWMFCVGGIIMRGSFYLRG